MALLVKTAYNSVMPHVEAVIRRQGLVTTAVTPGGRETTVIQVTNKSLYPIRWYLIP
jgi:hypothetical protein